MPKQPPNRPVLESTIETYFKKQIKRAGGIAFKFMSTVNGVPDQLVIHEGVTHYVEVKRPGGKPRADQVRCHAKMAAHGAHVHVLSTTDEVDAFVRDTLRVTLTAPRPRKTDIGRIKGADAFAHFADA